HLLSLLKTAQGHHMLQKGETYNVHLVSYDTWMNIHLREVIYASKIVLFSNFVLGLIFWRMLKCYIHGNTTKYLSVSGK
ncbi:hypothetical protein RJ641_035080, partial [Dillenia turbinata]